MASPGVPNLTLLVNIERGRDNLSRQVDKIREGPGKYNGALHPTSEAPTASSEYSTSALLMSTSDP